MMKTKDLALTEAEEDGIYSHFIDTEEAACNKIGSDNNYLIGGGKKEEKMFNSTYFHTVRVFKQHSTLYDINKRYFLTWRAHN